MKPIEFAFRYFGIAEIPGEKHNQIILEWFAAIGHSWVKEDEVANCAAFVNFCLLKTGCKHTGKLNARSLLDLPGLTMNPRFGDIVVFQRLNDGVHGHVGFYITERDGMIWTLGANQKNRVGIDPYRDVDLLGYRVPEKVIV